MAKAKKKEKPEVHTEEDEVQKHEEHTEGHEGDKTAGEASESAKPRGIVLNVEEPIGSVPAGEITRAEYIRLRWVEDKVGRGVIAKELSKLQGKDVPYQIVFAATKALKNKGIVGGPVKGEDDEEAGSEGAAEENTEE